MASLTLLLLLSLLLAAAPASALPIVVNVDSELARRGNAPVRLSLFPSGKDFLILICRPIDVVNDLDDPNGYGPLSEALRDG